MATKSATQRKKSAAPKRHSVSSGNPRSYGEMYKGDRVVPSTVNTPRPTSVQTVTAPEASVNWRQEYDYVIRDLRTLGIVTTVLFAVIIIAGFFI